MRNQNNCLWTGLAGLIVLITTVVIFISGFGKSQKEVIDYLAFTFIIFSEIVFFGGLIGMIILNNSTPKLFFRAGMISVLAGYWIITTFLSIVLKHVFNENIHGFITIQVILMAVSSIIMICLVIANFSIKSKDNNDKNNEYMLQKCESTVFSMLNNSQYAEIKKQLMALYEELKYSDKSTTLPEKEELIKNKIVELSSLEENALNDTTLKDKINDVISLIKERNMAVIQSKRGGY